MLRILAVAIFVASALAFAAPAPSPPLLPQSFAGWTQADAPPGPPNAADAAVLHEYGLAQSATATYASAAQRLTVHAWRFADATGAFGAFTFYRQPGMHVESIGREGASFGGHYVFWAGTTVVDATFARPSADEKIALAALASQIPPVGGAAGIPPSLPRYLPAAQLDATSVHYAIGPAAWARMGSQLPASSVDFSQDTEVVTAQYGPAGAQNTLTLLLYPTPQIAGAHRKAIDALAKSSGFATKRAGHWSPSSPAIRKAHSNCSAKSTSTITSRSIILRATSPKARSSTLLVGITMLAVVLMSSALLLGLFLGGGRALLRILRASPSPQFQKRSSSRFTWAGERENVAFWDRVEGVCRRFFAAIRQNSKALAAFAGDI